MAYTEADIRARIEKLEKGLVQVASGVTFVDRGTTYRRVSEIEAQIAYWQRKLRSLIGGRSKITYLSAEKGL